MGPGTPGPIPGAKQFRFLRAACGPAASGSSYWTSPMTEHLHKLWGGPPGPRPTPSSAFRAVEGPGSSSEERVQGTRSDQGLRPTSQAELREGKVDGGKAANPAR